ncbi:MAG: T9SS type A sorting domain-containing protein [Chitinophagaceae bacterium]|nr:T9SS type A sorting domain-containing protein [Chitinophagaceae bacterium]
MRNKISGAYFLKPVLAAIAVLLFCTQAFAQKPAVSKPVMKRCGTMEGIQQQMLNDPALRARIEQGEIDFQNSIRAGQANRPTSPASLPGPVTIPVVVHVVLPNPWMITDEAIQYFIDRLNLDYSGTNPDSTNGTAFYGVRGHSLLRFVMARRDPSGNFTTGVVRKVGTTPIGTTNPQPIKNSATATGGSTGWDVTKYYNVYVGDGSAAGLLGIAPAIGPGTAAATTNADGVCVDYTVFGPNCFSIPEFNMSRTAVHEIGHNFGLFHTFQGNCASADFSQLTSAGCTLPSSLLATADDTPPQNGSTSGCPPPGTSNGCTPPAQKMFQSYMDYTDDACYSMFSKGEAARMEWVLENCRPGYLTTLGGQYPASMQALDAAANSIVSPGGQDYSEATCTAVTYPSQSCPGIFTPRLRITNSGTTRLTSITVTTTINGLNPITQTLAVDIATGKSQVVTLSQQTSVPGANALKFVLSAPNGGTDGNATNDELTTNFTVVNALALPYTENFATLPFPPNNGSAVINPDADITWARTTLAGRPAPGSMRINLYNYDAIGERDIYRTPGINVSAFDSLKISFYVAHQQYSDASTPPTNDSLRVLYSPDCGATWLPTGFAKGGAVLSTVAGTTTADFVPANSGQWRKETLLLTDFCGQGLSNIQIGFESYTDFGNNIYIDSINIVGVASVNTNARMISILNPSNALCTSGFTPEITFGNSGGDTLKTLKINYTIDNGTPVTYNWTGSLAKCESATVSLAAANAAVGSHTIDVYTSEPNGIADQVPGNDRLTKSFSVFTTAATPLFEGFESTTFPSANWGIQNVNGGTTWERSITTARTGTGALLLNNPNTANSNDAVDYFISPIVENSGLFDSVFVSFDRSYVAGVNYPGSTVFPLDTLELLATTDCGATFTSVWKKWGDALQTINDPNYSHSNPFVPSFASEWSTEKIYLTPIVGSANFQLYFAMKGNKQNNLWLDNINITSQKLPQRLKDQGYLIYPNPFNNTFLIHHSAVEPPVDLKAVQVYNSAGQLVWSNEYNGNAARQITVDLKGAANGLYILKMIYSNKTVVERIIKH